MDNSDDGPSPQTSPATTAHYPEIEQNTKYLLMNAQKDFQGKNRYISTVNISYPSSSTILSISDTGIQVRRSVVVLFSEATFFFFFHGRWTSHIGVLMANLCWPIRTRNLLSGRRELKWSWVRPRTLQLSGYFKGSQVQAISHRTICTFFPHHNPIETQLLYPTVASV